MSTNTSRGAPVDMPAEVKGLESGAIGDLFFEDPSYRLLTISDVLVIGNQASFNTEALENIAVTTIANITAVEPGEAEAHLVGVGRIE